MDKTNMNRVQRWMRIATAAAGVSIALPAFAQSNGFARIDDAIKYRQSALVLQNYHLGRLAAMVNGRIPFDPKAAVEHAETLAAVSRLPFVAFIDESHKGNTRAKPEIWTEKDKFNAAAAKLHEEVVKLNATAKTGDLAQIKSAVGAVGKSCKACHDDYQKSH
jgi:cytochrome c556